MRIVYFHTEDTHEKYPQSWDAVRALTAQFGILFEETPSNSPFAHYEALARHWGKDDLISIERSVVPDPYELQELIDCPEPNCTHFYRTSPLYVDAWNIGFRIKDPTGQWLIPADWTADEIREKLLYVTFTGSGFVKISRPFQRSPLPRFTQMQRPEHAPFNINPDNAIITSMNRGLYGFSKFHVHREIRHLRSRKHGNNDRD